MILMKKMVQLIFGKKVTYQEKNVKVKMLILNYLKKKQLKLKKGSLIIFLGQTWHQLGKNYSGDKRWGVLFHLKRWWIKPSTNYSAFFFKSIFQNLLMSRKCCLVFLQ